MHNPSGYDNMNQALPLRQQSSNATWTDENHQLTTPPPDEKTAHSAVKDAVKPGVAGAANPAVAGPDWETHKHIINDLYMGQNLNLNEVVERMKAHGFHAT